MAGTKTTEKQKTTETTPTPWAVAYDTDRVYIIGANQREVACFSVCHHHGENVKNAELICKAVNGAAKS